MLPQIELGAISTSLIGFTPELLVCFSIVLLLLMRLVPVFDRSHLGTMALLLTLLCLGWSVVQWTGVPNITSSGQVSGTLMEPISPKGDPTQFGGMLVNDSFTVFLRCILYGFAALIIWLSLATGIPDREDSADFYVLILGSTLGMVLMGSSMHLLMVFIAIEMASLPSYALAGFQGQAPGQRGGPEVRRLRRRGGGRDALRHQPAGRQVRHRLPAGPGRGDGLLLLVGQR